MGHRADENIRLEDLVTATKIIACTLYDLLVEGRGISFEKIAGELIC